MGRTKIMEIKMKYYINKNKELFGFELDGSHDYLITEDIQPISLEEIEAINKAKEDVYKNSIKAKINEAKQYLDETDHKFYGDYEPKVGEDLEAIRAKRNEARAFVRANRWTLI